MPQAAPVTAQRRRSCVPSPEPVGRRPALPDTPLFTRLMRQDGGEAASRGVGKAPRPPRALWTRLAGFWLILATWPVLATGCSPRPLATDRSKPNGRRTRVDCLWQEPEIPDPLEDHGFSDVHLVWGATRFDADQG